MADMLGVTFATVNRWENGKHEPSIKQKRAIRDLCIKYGIVENLNERN
jgi:putative transcriptional regulator